MRLRRGALAVAALAAYVVAVVRRHESLDVSAAFFHAGPEPSAADGFRFDVLDPLRPGHGYLWLGIALSFTAVSVALTLARRGPGGRRTGAAASGVIALGCVAVTLLQRHDSQLPRREFEGAYFQPSGGERTYSVSGTDLFAPFTPLDAYLWLGLAVGFAVGAVVALAPARRSR